MTIALERPVGTTDPAALINSEVTERLARRIAPSELVDIGWHTFILHTVDYAAFCEMVAGRFVHHVPKDEDEQLPGGAAETRDRTLFAIAAAGYTVDLELWPDVAKCTQCHAGCTDSPKNG